MLSPAFSSPCALRASLSASSAASLSARPAAPVSAPRARRRQHQPRMGLFGLGLPELAVIGGIGILIFGPSKIVDMGKDLGGVAGSVKKASAEFQEAMSESIAEADAEIEERKSKKGTVVKAVEMQEEETVVVKKAEVMDE